MKNIVSLLLICLVIHGFSQNQNLPVGKISGELGVTSSGGAMYSIPIELPVARVGMKPAISFVYNSQQRLGNILGQGWSVSGFSSISRANPTLYYNGKNGHVDFTNDDYMLVSRHN